MECGRGGGGGGEREWSVGEGGGGGEREWSVGEGGLPVVVHASSVSLHLCHQSHHGEPAEGMTYLQCKENLVSLISLVVEG